MSYFDISGAVFNNQLRELETSDPAHADVFNAVFRQLINNDVALMEAASMFAGEKNKQKYRIVVHRSVIAYDYRRSLYPAILHAFVLVQNFGVETRFLHGIGGYFGKSVEKSYH